MRGGILMIAAVSLALGYGAAQTSSSKSGWTARTADGQPDLQGLWSNATITPLERPADLAGKAVLTADEAAAYEKQVVERTNADKRTPGTEGDVATAYNNFWYDRGTKVIGTRRTSLIVDPPDGKIPALTPEAQQRVDQARARAAEHPADGPEDRSLGERCLLWRTAGPPMLPGPYNNDFQIIQAPGYVVIINEMIHDTRLIPLDGRPHLPAGIRQWRGDPRGHWEGSTLVVDSTNFTAKTRFAGADENLHLTERFRRNGPDSLVYEFTVDDPTAFAKSWTASIPVTKADGRMYEYACHEGNYAMTDMLAGARAEEKKSAEGPGRKGPR